MTRPRLAPPPGFRAAPTVRPGYAREVDVQIRLLPSGASVTAARGTTLMAAVRRVGLPIATACGTDGLCGRCGVRVLEGAAALSAETAAETRTKTRNRVDPALRLACQAAVAGNIEITASYW